MLEKRWFALQLLTFVLSLTTLAHAGFNGVQVNELPSQVTVQVFQTAQGKDFRVLGQNFIKASLTCSVPGWRVKRLGPGAFGLSPPTTAGGTKATYSWFFSELDLQPHFSKMVNACNTGQKSFQLNFLPAHACYRKMGIASAGAPVNQSKLLTVNVECATVNKTFYTLPHKSCFPVSAAMPTKTGHHVNIGCDGSPGTLPNSGSVSMTYVETFSVFGRRIPIPSLCKLPKKLEKQYAPGGVKTTSIKAGLICSKKQKSSFPSKMVDGVKVEFINAVQFNDGLPIVPLPAGCSQVGATNPFDGGRWVQIACNTTHGSVAPVQYTENGKTVSMLFAQKPNFVTYGQGPLGPLVVLPTGCVQESPATIMNLRHYVPLVCTQDRQVPEYQNVGASKFWYQVKGRVPQGCTPEGMNGLSAVWITCKPPVVCQTNNNSVPAVVCKPQTD